MNFNVDKMKLLMAENLLDPGDFCQLVGISYSAYQKIAAGKSKPKLATIGKIARALNVKVKDLLED